MFFACFFVFDFPTLPASRLNRLLIVFVFVFVYSFVLSELVQMKKNSVQADERARHMVVHCAILWGWRDSAEPIAID